MLVFTAISIYCPVFFLCCPQVFLKYYCHKFHSSFSFQVLPSSFSYWTSCIRKPLLGATSLASFTCIHEKSCDNCDPRAHTFHKYHKLYLWKKIVMSRNFGTIWEIWEILGFGEFLRNFATIYSLSCGEKLSPKVHLWRKKWQMWGLVTYKKNL